MAVTKLSSCRYLAQALWTKFGRLSNDTQLHAHASPQQGAFPLLRSSTWEESGNPWNATHAYSTLGHLKVRDLVAVVILPLSHYHGRMHEFDIEHACMRAWAQALYMHIHECLTCMRMYDRQNEGAG